MSVSDEDECVCGHTRDEHGGTVPAADNTRCTAKDCGCREFEAAEDEDLDDDREDGEEGDPW